WLRKMIEVGDPVEFQTAAVRVRHDEDVEMYVNGKRVFVVTGFNVRRTAYDVTAELKASLKPGRNVVAVHVHQTSGGQYIDLGLVLDPKEKPAMRIDPQALARLRASRWPVEKAWKWYGEIGPIAGCNYLPRTAVNSTEMWQKETFDPKTIDEELGWAGKCGMNSVRVFVQYIVYEADPEGLIERMERFLEIADRHGISVMFILFDDCWIQEPKLGKQPDPVPGLHNSQWTASPGKSRKARENWPALEKYTTHVVGHFAGDKRVILWDLFNEAKGESRPLVEAAFGWARSAKPTQPLSACWQASDLWDVATFHDYHTPNAKSLAERTAERPALCTECIARTFNPRFDAIVLPMAEHGIGWYMWGLVKGRIQTHYPWGSKRDAPEPKVWFHDLLHPDGTPYDPREIEFIRRFHKEFKMPRRADRWSQEQANNWYEEAGPIRGCNYLPRSATNTTEMWQKETFDPKTIDEELAWAKSVGFNSLRVFVQYLVWENDPDGLKQRMEEFLRIADSHGIRTMWVLLDDCAFGYPAKHEPYLGPQGDPKPGEYAPFWTPSPGRRRVADRRAWPKLREYVTDLVGAYGDDRRVLAWDLYNEARGENRPLIEAAFAWARRAGPSQPLTTCWHAHDLADVISFHCYGSPDAMRNTIRQHKTHGRPVLCTEWLLRRGGNTVADILPVLEEEQVGWFIWGLVTGRTQTCMHWSSKPGDPIPENWQHDIFQADGTAYREEENALFRKVSTKE
ncbi:MAG: hypothetical protein HQ581_21845, partial [Planctomycetes bacterium]|nr:hypothetical protein [Planctomycetota bacterium]